MRERLRDASAARIAALLFFLTVVVGCASPVVSQQSDATRLPPESLSVAGEEMKDVAPTDSETVAASEDGNGDRTAVEVISHPLSRSCSPKFQAEALRDDINLVRELDTVSICYQVEFELEESGDSFVATTRAVVRNTSDDVWPYLLFRLYPRADEIFGGEIEIEEVRADNQVVQARTVFPDRTGLEVLLSAALIPGETVLVEIRLKGEIPELEGEAGAYGIFARTDDTITLASWIPLLAVWDDGADDWEQVPVLGEGDAVFSESAFIHAFIQGPQRFDLASSGVVLDTRVQDGNTEYEIVTGPARDLTLVWLEGYRSEEVLVDETTIRNWYRPGDEEGAQRALDASYKALEIFNEAFGPYPFEELDVVEVPLAGVAGVEYPQLFLLAEYLYDSPQSHEYLEFTAAHEMAHQWWYSTVGNDINAAPWQDEALTNWSALYWLEQTVGEDAAREERENFAGAVDAFEALEGEEAITQPLAKFQGRSAAYGTIVYLKGALFFEALRDALGDEKFFDALRDYYTENLFDVAPASQLLQQFEKETGSSLDDLYEEWGIEQQYDEVEAI